MWEWHLKPGNRQEGTTRMVKSHCACHLGCEDGFHKKTQMGVRWTQVHRPTCAGVVLRESVRIACTHAARNGLDVCVLDIRNAHLQTPSLQKDYIICGPEFGIENEGKFALIGHALHGRKAAGHDFRNHLCYCMKFLEFESCKADPEVWMRR